MKSRHLSATGSACLLMLASAAVNAYPILQSRLGGLAYYDSQANLTWLANANENGPMTWSAAKTWADSLTVDGVSGWSLPTTADTSCTAYNCTGSELGNLFYNVLGGKSGTSITATHDANYTDFFNVQSAFYWSATASNTYPAYVWGVEMNDGYQTITVNDIAHHAWAVHTGDVGAVTAPSPKTVPDPPTAALLALGLVGMGAIRRRSKARNS